MDNPTDEIERMRQILLEMIEIQNQEINELEIEEPEEDESSSGVGWIIPSPELKARQRFKRVNYKGNVRYF